MENLKPKQLEQVRQPFVPRAELLPSQEPSPLEVQGIINCCLSAWSLQEKADQDPVVLYPYDAFLNPASWQGYGEIAVALREQKLFIGVVKNDKGEPVACAMHVRGDKYEEVGRIFASETGNRYDIMAIDRIRQHLEEMDIRIFNYHISNNRTAAERAAEEVFFQNDWKIAASGQLPKNYAEPKANPVSWWGENVFLISRDTIRLPNVDKLHPRLRRLANGIQEHNDCIAIEENDEIGNVLQPNQLSENHIWVDWHDNDAHQAYIDAGHIPTAIIPIQGRHGFIMYRGELPERRQGISRELQAGHSPVWYRGRLGNANVHEVMNIIYEQ